MERRPFSHACYKLWPLSSLDEVQFNIYIHFHCCFLCISFVSFQYANHLLLDSTPSAGSDLVTHTGALNQASTGQ